jgi:G8 domain
MIYVPSGLHLLVDVDTTPILSAVLVEGSLIFAPNPDPNHLKTFDCHYIMVRNGYMEVGTEEFPYTSKLVITMHSDQYSPEIPIYGNKVIAVRNGVLDMHGIPRDPVWTDLDSTVLPGATQITLIRAVDW